jgi:dienelactone hydrolase
MRWLKGSEDNEGEKEEALETEETLRATETGQVATSLGGETVFSLNLKRVEQNRPSRPPLSTRPAVEALRDRLGKQVRELTHFEKPTGPLINRPYGEIRREGYRIEKWIYESEPGILIPSLLFLPDDGATRKPALLYVHGRGKSFGVTEIEQFVKAGSIVLSIDMRGLGETQFTTPDLGLDFPRFFGDYGSAMKALLIGKTLLGMRMRDVARALDWLAAEPRVDADRIYAFGRDAAGVVLLQAAALDGRIRKLALEGALVSYESVVTQRIHRGVFETVVPGVLRAYDLDDLAAAFAPRDLWIVNSMDPLNRRVALEEVHKQYARARQAFATVGAADRLRVGEHRPQQTLSSVYPELLAGDR